MPVGTSILVRDATAADVPAVLPLVWAIVQFHHDLDPTRYAALTDAAERYRPWLTTRATDARSAFVVAEAVKGDVGERTVRRVVGFAVATVERELPIYRLREYGLVHDLWVEPGYRRGGAGRRIVEAVIDRMRDMGVRQVRLFTAASNDRARRLFGSAGFHASSVEMTRQT